MEQKPRVYAAQSSWHTPLPIGNAGALGRDALLARALNGYTDDSTDESRAATCAAVAQRLPGARRERLVTAGEACLAYAECAPIAACAVPISIQP